MAARYCCCLWPKECNICRTEFTCRVSKADWRSKRTAHLCWNWRCKVRTSVKWSLVETFNWNVNTHTCVYCRYVFHPLESMYLLLITNKGSNIIEDLETLQLLSKGWSTSCTSMILRTLCIALLSAFDWWPFLSLDNAVVPDTCGTVTEESVTEQGFELIFAFDEVVTVGGNKVGISMSELHVNLVRTYRNFYENPVWIGLVLSLPCRALTQPHCDINLIYSKGNG